MEFIATKITTKKIYYTCPFCFTNSSGKVFQSQEFKNGKLAVGRKPTIHHHGNETGKLDNFTTSRSSHCSIINGNVEIIINDTTLKI